MTLFRSFLVFFTTWFFWGVLARHVVECVSGRVCLMFSHDSTGVKVLRIPLRLTVLLSSYQGTKYQHDLSLFILFDVQFNSFLSYYIMAFIFVDFIVFWFFFFFFPCSFIHFPRPHSLENSAMVWIFPKSLCLLIQVFLLEGEADMSQRRKLCVSFYYPLGDETEAVENLGSHSPGGLRDEKTALLSVGQIFPWGWAIWFWNFQLWDSVVIWHVTVL